MGKGNEGDSKGFSKSDMERMGIFNEMGYITIGDQYKGSRSCKYQEKSQIDPCHVQCEYSLSQI